MFNPVSTYRIQFHKDFTFKSLGKIIPYLQQLGVSMLYASPVFEAVPGSNHGYDVLNPHRINPEIGTLDELRSLSNRLKKSGISWLQDIVPNHMAFDPGNAWLMDVLEKGRESTFAHYFDIIWSVPAFKGKLMVPFLGDTPEKLIDDGQLQIAFKNDGFKIIYGGQAYPINLPSIIKLLQAKEQPGALKKLLDLNPAIDEFKKQLLRLSKQPEVDKYMLSVVENTNSDKQLLKKIINEQYYQLSYWKDSEVAINYRRFFTVNGLICLNMQDQQVFDHYHRFIKELLQEDIFQGFRVDHVDGLFDPTTYLTRLRALAGADTYIVVEKILEQGEEFPANWPVQGSTGYDFLAMSNNLFTTTANRRLFAEFYEKSIANNKPVNKAILQKKADILYKHMAGEHKNLYQLFADLELTKFSKNQVSANLIKEAIGEFLIYCPVYRYYGNRFPLNNIEQEAIAKILREVEQARPELKPAAQLLAEIWLGDQPNEEQSSKALYFYQRCLQFAGPLMAKGVEDTLMYTNNLFIGHNEVGDSPAAFGVETNEFHRLMQQRQQTLPLSVNATSTHDTKRGEDVRARLNVLTDIGQEWIKTVANWRKLNAPLKKNNIPDKNDEYLVYQTLVGFFPMPGAPNEDTENRLKSYLTKAIREAKVHSQWAEPNEEYENGTLNFATALLNQQSKFWKSFIQLQNKVAGYAVTNSLSQVLLKFTCPGVPDVYQGCELWDLSLVDPDNRRPVNYEERAEMVAAATPFASLWQNRYSSNIKLRLTQLLMHLRKANSELFIKGAYVPLEVKGKYQHHILAFARQHLREWIVVVVPLGLAALTKNSETAFDWKDTSIILPENAPLQWQPVCGGTAIVINDTLAVADVLQGFPFALIKSQATNGRRSAGIIMHVTSLPSPFGIGDMGPEARSFASFLSRANHQYWQLLPINPTGPAANYSPYSAYSSMAGYTLLISPEDLQEEKLLTPKELQQYQISTEDTTDFNKAGFNKEVLFALAYNRFKQHPQEDKQKAFVSFCKNQAGWLDDYALYEALKTNNDNKPWYEWTEEYKCRDQNKLKAFSDQNQESIEKIKWLQFIFFKQWTALKVYGNQLGIKFLGDLPFYVNYDSSDVWTHHDFFKLDNNKLMSGIAGVPPDYFNADGQLWGMPVYNWEALAKTNYSWWVDRIRKNREFFDAIRLDHFRAFYNFWEVPAGETTAVNGSWQYGPGTALFDVLKKELGDLPFIAEDLGDVNPGVYTLRDKLNLPGMNLLQYAFGADMPISVHIPHNHRNNSVTYTGTHDNNTSIGWYKENASKLERQNLNNYTRSKVNQHNVHKVLIELCYSSVANLAIIPLQDILGLDERYRMNLPASKEGNWNWRLPYGELKEEITQQLRRLIKKFNR